MADHSIYSPSSARRWMACNKSLLSSFVVQQDNEIAKKGTDIHDEIETALDFFREACNSPTLKDHLNDFRLIGEYDDITGECERIPLSRIAKKLIEALHDIVDLEQGVGETEKQVFFVNGNNMAFGTCDYIHAKKEDNTIYVVDYKTGMLEVEAKDNEQLLCYACGVEPFNLQTKYKLIILQMSEFDKEVRTDIAEYTAEQILDFKAKIAEAVNKVESGEIEEIAGEHCTYCKIKQTCKSFTRYLANESKRLESEEFKRMDLYVRVKTAKTLEKQVKVVIDEVKQLLDQEKEIEGCSYRLQKHGVKWDEYAEGQLYELFGDKIYHQVLLEPSELKELIGNEFSYIPEECIKQVTRKILKID